MDRLWAKMNTDIENNREFVDTLIPNGVNAWYVGPCLRGYLTRRISSQSIDILADPPDLDAFLAHICGLVAYSWDPNWLTMHVLNSTGKNVDIKIMSVPENRRRIAVHVPINCYLREVPYTVLGIAMHTKTGDFSDQFSARDDIASRMLCCSTRRAIGPIYGLVALALSSCEAFIPEDRGQNNMNVAIANGHDSISQCVKWRQWSHILKGKDLGLIQYYRDGLGRNFSDTIRNLTSGHLPHSASILSRVAALMTYSGDAGNKIIPVLGIPEDLVGKARVLMQLTHWNGRSLKDFNILIRWLAKQGIDLQSFFDYMKNTISFYHTGARHSSLEKFNKIIRDNHIAIPYNPPPPYLEAEDFMTLGAKPGPELGSLLRAARDAQAIGVFSGREAALRWAARLYRKRTRKNALSHLS